MQKKRSAPKQKAKKSSARSKVKNAALNPNYSPRIRREYLDFDYLDQLSDKDKEFLNKFVEEELNASFKKRGNLNKTKAERREVYSANNQRNRDAFGIGKATNRLILTGESVPYAEGNEKSAHDYEDALIDFIDSKDKKD
jgi:hypothetical protein